MADQATRLRASRVGFEKAEYSDVHRNEACTGHVMTDPYWADMEIENAGVAKLVDALGLGPSGAIQWRFESSPRHKRAKRVL